MDDPYRQIADDRYRGWIHEDLLSALPSPGWIPESDPPPESILKDSPETTVYRQVPPGWPEEVVVKRYNRPGALRRWKDLARVPRALRSLRAGAGFIRRGVPTPEPLAAVAMRRGGNRSWLVTRALAGYRSLAEMLNAPPDLPGLVEAIREMHGKGIVHGDLKPVNILVREGRFAFIDLDAARLQRRASPRGIARDLGQLDSYARPACPAHRRRTFFRLYRRDLDREARRRILRWVVDEARRREARRCVV